jgi:5-hydroxyisourate hydrolase-like protein (transthyretin family)
VVTKPPVTPKPPVKVATVFGVSASGKNPVVLTAALTNKATRKPLTGQMVSLRVKWQGTSTWVALASLRTDSAGRVTHKVSTTRPGYYHFVFGGTAAAAASGTAAPLVAAVIPAPAKVKTYFTLDQSKGAPVTLTGTLIVNGTSTPIPNQPVFFKVMYAGSDKWVTLAKMTTDAKGQVSAQTSKTRTGRYAFTHEGSATTWQSSTAHRLVQVFPPDAPKGFFFHLVSEEDTLRAIADRYEVHRYELRWLNKLADGQEPKADTWLLVPTRETHEHWH